MPPKKNNKNKPKQNNNYCKQPTDKKQIYTVEKSHKAQNKGNTNGYAISKLSLELMRNHFNECINKYISHLKNNDAPDKDLETFLDVMLEQYEKALEIYPPN